MALINEHHKKLLLSSSCEVAFDDLTRQLYATDASIYRIEPQAVAFPKSVEEVCSIVRIAYELGIPVTPRGTGSGVTGGAIGPGLVLDFSRYFRRILSFDQDRSVVKVEVGVVLDLLNAWLKPQGFTFGPEVATSSRATIGGMVGNDSSGARTLLYGTTADHVIALEGVLVTGEHVRVTRDRTEPSWLGQRIQELVMPYERVVLERFPDKLPKRWPGYGFDRYLRDGRNPCYIVVGSEGTLMLVTAVELRVVPLPSEVGMAVIFFESLEDALESAPELIALRPAAVEVVDRILFDQTRGQLQFTRARRFLGLDEFQGECFLIVEVYDEIEEKLANIAKMRLGVKLVTTCDKDQINQVWALRKAGLSLLTARKGPKKPVAGIEDTVVRVDHLASYARDVRKLLREFNVEASFYGHAESGLLHIRPMLDLRNVEDAGKFRALADAVSELVLKYNGSIAGEHGCGIARTEYLRAHLGGELSELARGVKSIFDPSNLLNPGKVVDSGVYKIDSDLRFSPGYRLELPFDPVLRFARRDESFLANLDQCNGCAGCRKLTPTMCPTYVATGLEEMCTRGRANTIRAALEGRFSERDPLAASELHRVLSSCLSCKACTAECPSNVSLPLLKAELLHAYHRRYGKSASVVLFGYIDVVSKLGSAFRFVANPSMEWKFIRWLLLKLFGVTPRRRLPRFSGNVFGRWYRKHGVKSGYPRSVILWDDTYVRYYEPEIGIAAARVLNALGFNVILVDGHKCCGRPAFSQGLLDRAKRLGTHNLQLLRRYPSTYPIIFLEPSCWSMFVDDYVELGVDGAEEVARRCVMFDQFLGSVLEERDTRQVFDEREELVAVHVHCHAKSLAAQTHWTGLIEKLPGRKCQVLETGCCGMAGAFGMMEDKYELSVEVARILVDRINALPEGTKVVINGTSCRQQVLHLTNVRPIHLAQLFEDALKSSDGGGAVH